MTSPNDEELATPEPGSEAFARHVLIGLLVETADLGRRGISTAGGAVVKTGLFWAALLEPVLSSPLLAPVRRSSEAVIRRGSAEFERWARLGSVEEARSKDLARQLIHIPVDEVVEVLRNDPKLKELVRDQARVLLGELEDDDELKTLVRVQGDGYVDHLREEPEGVRDLLTSQSSGLTTDLANVVRGWATTMDGHLDRWVGKILGRQGPDSADGSRELGDDAGFASRFLGFVVDSAILAFVTVVGGWIWASALQAVGIDPLHCGSTAAGTALAGVLCRIALWIGVGVTALFPIAYLLFFWTAAGQTPGKLLAGVRIVRMDRSPVSFTTSVVRVFGYGVSIWTFGLGFLAILFNRHHLGWHDRIARTRVVYSWQPEEP